MSMNVTPLAPEAVSLIPAALRNIPAVELVALLHLRGSRHALACAGYLAETENTIAVTAEHQFMLVTLGLAKGRVGVAALTVRGRMAAELLIRHIAVAIGLHITVVGMTPGRTGFVKCTCGWQATQLGWWSVTRPLLEHAGGIHVRNNTAGAMAEEEIA